MLRFSGRVASKLLVNLEVNGLDKHTVCIRCSRFFSGDSFSKGKKKLVKESNLTVKKVKGVESNLTEAELEAIKEKELERETSKGSVKNWLKMNYGVRLPKNMPTESSKLDAIDRIAITSANDDYDYNTVNLVASYYDSETKDWENFERVITAFKKPGKSGMRVGQVEFIYGSMKRLKDYGLNKDVRAYNALLNVFPKGEMLPTNIFQAGFLHYAKQQFCATDLLEEMEWNQVCPDQKTVDSVIAIFGERSHVYEKMGGMIYWITKARYSDPYPLPNFLPTNPKELAKISFRRMCLDCNTQISVYSTESIPESIDKTWIVSAMSPVQEKIINRLSEPLFIDGPHVMWLKDHMTNYFILRTGPKEPLKDESEEELEDMRNLPLYAHGGLSKQEHLARIEAVHRTEEGIICGLVATGTSSRDSLLSYIRILQHHLPKLNELSVIFTQRAPETALSPLEEEQNNSPSESKENVKLIVNK